MKILHTYDVIWGNITRKLCSISDYLNNIFLPLSCKNPKVMYYYLNIT